jgi:hypothetical protein
MTAIKAAFAFLKLVLCTRKAVSLSSWLLCLVRTGQSILPSLLFYITVIFVSNYTYDTECKHITWNDCIHIWTTKQNGFAMLKGWKQGLPALTVKCKTGDTRNSGWLLQKQIRSRCQAAQKIVQFLGSLLTAILTLEDWMRTQVSRISGFKQIRSINCKLCIWTVYT